MKKQIIKIDLDLCIESDTVQDEQKQILKIVKKAMTAGLLSQFDSNGPNEMPVIWLKGEKDKVLAWILKNYDEDFESDILDSESVM